MHVSDPLLEQGSLLELSLTEELLLIEAQQEILDGEYYTQEEVEKMVEDWESADYRKTATVLDPEDENELLDIRAAMIAGEYFTEEEADAELNDWL